MKKEKINYFGLFAEQAEYFCKAAELLSEIIKNFDAFDIPQAKVKMHEIENAADEVKRKLAEALAKEFLPPIEREDIIQIASELDNVTDSVEDILLHIYMFNIKEMTAEAVEFADIILNGCKKLKNAVAEFGNFKKAEKLKSMIIEVNSNEDAGDAVFEKCMRTLFSENVDPIKLISWTKIYQIMEDCCDNCEHAADMIEVTVLKNT